MSFIPLTNADRWPEAGAGTHPWALLSETDRSSLESFQPELFGTNASIESPFPGSKSGLFLLQ